MTRDELLASLRIPLMQAPMSIASTADLAEAACLAGVMGCFTTTNAHKAEGLRPWINRVQDAIAEEQARGGRPAPLAVNVNLAKFKPREQIEDEPWSMVWSGGQSLALIDDTPSVAELVERLEAEYRAATGQPSAKAWARA